MKPEKQESELRYEAPQQWPDLPGRDSSEPGIFPQCELRPCLHRGWLWHGIRWRKTGVYLQQRWYCSLECFERALSEMLAQQRDATGLPKYRSHRVPLGLVLLSLGVIRADQLRAALQAQLESGRGQIGEWLGRLGAVTEREVTAGLATQWSCPVFPLERYRTFLEYADIVPLPILETCRAVAVHWSPASRRLHMAFADGIDYTVLYAIEQMLEFRTEPCLATKSAVEGALDQIRVQPRPWEVVLDSLQDPDEIARMVKGYANVLDARQVRVANCHQYFWIRLRSSRPTATLLFRLTPGRMASDQRTNGGSLGRTPKLDDQISD